MANNKPTVDKQALLMIIENELIYQAHDLDVHRDNPDPQVNDLFQKCVGKIDMLNAVKYYCETGSTLYFFHNS